MLLLNALEVGVEDGRGGLYREADVIGERDDDGGGDKG